MKKTIAMLICALLALLPALALAEEISENPFDNLPGGQPEESEPGQGPTSDEEVILEIGGESVHLGFDPSPQYSSVQDGTIQASYYTYGADNSTLYELFLSLPETVKAGMIITPEYASMTNQESSVVLIISRDGQEKYYMSSLMNGDVYPGGSTFSISVENIADVDGGTRYSGSFSATLIELNMVSGEIVDTLEIPETPFSFTLSGDHSRHTEPTETPAPDNTGDMRKV